LDRGITSDHLCSSWCLDDEAWDLRSSGKRSEKDKKGMIDQILSAFGMPASVDID
jgi:hypothetical protein